jgi:hypothetical protein
MLTLVLCALLSGVVAGAVGIIWAGLITVSDSEYHRHQNHDYDI